MFHKWTGNKIFKFNFTHKIIYNNTKIDMYMLFLSPSVEKDVIFHPIQCETLQVTSLPSLVKRMDQNNSILHSPNTMRCSWFLFSSFPPSSLPIDIKPKTKNTLGLNILQLGLQMGFKWNNEFSLLINRFFGEARVDGISWSSQLLGNNFKILMTDSICCLE